MVFANANRPTRRLDHTVLAMPSLEAARTLFTSLGFIVAPDARHPFGTENACVFFHDGSFIEPLAVGHRETCEGAAREGNVFVARDQAHRFRVGAPSFSGVAFASRDADVDAAEFGESGFGTGEQLAFERRFSTPAGEESVIGFRLSFARDLRAPDVSFFTCQPTQAHKPDRSTLVAHPNGVRGTARLVFGEPNPTDFQYYLQELTGDREFDADSFGMRLSAGDTVLEVASPQALAMRYGASRGEERGLSFEGLVLNVGDLANVRSWLEASGLPFEERAPRLIARIAPSAFIAFEEVAP